jgi:hypothetical protein
MTFLPLYALKGHGNVAGVFRGVCINRFGIGPLHYMSSRSDFGFKFAEIFVIEESESHQLPDFPSRGVPIQNFFNLSSIYRTLNTEL